MNKNFNLEICSDLNYEGLVVDISYKNDLIATLNQDKDIDNIEIKLYSIKVGTSLKLSYKDFVDVLEKAKKLLIEINKKNEKM
ncbi:MAG: hypothetical protein WC688_05415 [Parachlamydiales bacterium]|jgi:hypothetical protein